MTTDINSVNFTDAGILEFMQIPATSFKCTKCNYGYDFDLGKVIADELIKQWNEIDHKKHIKENPMDIGQAINAMKKGLKVARSGWNGKGMFLYYVPENKYPASRNEHGTMIGVFPDDMVPYGAYIAMKTAQNNVVPWLASQTDVLAEDWVLVQDEKS